MEISAYAPAFNCRVQRILADCCTLRHWIACLTQCSEEHWASGFNITKRLCYAVVDLPVLLARVFPFFFSFTLSILSASGLVNQPWLTLCYQLCVQSHHGISPVKWKCCFQPTVMLASVCWNLHVACSLHTRLASIRIRRLHTRKDVGFVLWCSNTLYLWRVVLNLHSRQNAPLCTHSCIFYRRCPLTCQQTTASKSKHTLLYFTYFQFQLPPSVCFYIVPERMSAHINVKNLSV